ncbi:MAG: hypothetical protein ACYTG0_33315, partial [Planctomycetota bacterium]
EPLHEAGSRSRAYGWGSSSAGNSAGVPKRSAARIHSGPVEKATDRAEISTRYFEHGKSGGVPIERIF